MKSQKKYLIHDSIYLGALFGTIMPGIGALIYKLVEFQDFDWNEYFNYIFISDVLAKVISICVIINLIAVYIFNYLRYEKAVKGVIIVTILYAILSGIMIFV